MRFEVRTSLQGFDISNTFPGKKTTKRRHRPISAHLLYISARVAISDSRESRCKVITTDILSLNTAPARLRSLTETPAPPGFVGSPHLHVLLHHCAPQQQAEALGPRRGVWQRHVHALLEPPSHRVVEVPGAVAGCEHHDAVTGRVVLALAVPLTLALVQAVHLRKELVLESPRGLVLARGPARGGEGVDLVDEDDAGSVVARHGEERGHQLLALAEPLRHQDRRRDVEEGGARLGGV